MNDVIQIYEKPNTQVATIEDSSNQVTSARKQNPLTSSFIKAGSTGPYSTSKPRGAYQGGYDENN
jgi:hypothetical protein